MKNVELSIFDLGGTRIEHEHEFFISRLLEVSGDWGYAPCRVSLDHAYRSNRLLEYLQLHYSDRARITSFFNHKFVELPFPSQSDLGFNNNPRSLVSEQ